VLLFVLKFVVLALIGLAFASKVKRVIKETTVRYDMQGKPQNVEVEVPGIHIPTIVAGVVALIVAGLLMTSFGALGAGERGVVLQFGATTGRVLQPGIYAVVPLIESVHAVDVQVQKEEVNKATAVSHDLQQVWTNVALNYYVRPEGVSILYKTVGDAYKNRIIDPAVQEALKAVTARFSAEDLIARRNEAKVELVMEIQNRLATHNIVVDAVSLTDFQFTEEFTNAIEAKVTAAQLALKAENDLDRVRFESEQRLNRAEAEAKSIEIQARAIQNQGGAEYVRLQAISKWDGKLPVNMYGSAPVPFLNIAAHQ